MLSKGFRKVGDVNSEALLRAGGKAGTQVPSLMSGFVAKL